MAAEAERRGDTVDPYVLEKARKQGFGGNPQTTSFAESRQTVPVRENISLPGTLTDSQMSGSNTVDVFVPFGNRAQTEIKNAKVVAAPSGEVGIYQKAHGHSIWQLTSSGSPAALQSGRFTINKPETPVVFTQESGGKRFAASADYNAAMNVLANPDKFSRTGAEVYDGSVQPLDNRTVQSTGAKLSTYSNPNNLAGLVDPYAVNVPRGQRERITVPWGNAISDSTPAVSVIGGDRFATEKSGRASPQPQQQDKQFGGQNIPSFNESNAKRPFVSAGISRERIEPTGELPFVGVVPVISPTLAGVERGLQDAGIIDKQTLTKRTSWSPAEDQFNVVDRDPDTGAYGAAYTRALINDKGQKSLEGSTEDATYKLSPTMAGKTTGEITTEKGAITNFEDSIRTRLPSPEGGEQAVRAASLTNPFMAAPVIASVLTERFNPNAAEGSRNIESLVGMRGQYSDLYKRPLAMGTSYAIGAGFGAVTRGAGAAIPAITRLSPTAGKVVIGAGKWGGRVLTLGYGADVASRSTEGFTDFDPMRVAGKAIVTTKHELVPMTIGFGHGYALPDTARAGYANVKTTARELPARTKTFAESSYTKVSETAGGIRKSIPSVDQMRYKWVEIREPGSAMSTPAANERFGFTDRARGITNSNKWVEARRISMRGSGTRTASERGSVSGRPTPRQESLRLNYNPTSPLKEINTNIATTSRAKNILSGIRGTLKGKWDTASTAVDEFAHLPLKERWKARTAAKDQPGTKRYFGSGKPAGGLQSGVGEFGTTVRSGRQSLEIRSASSGISAEIESFAPQRLEITPSRQTAQRSRAFDMDFGYESRKLPSGMQRPQPAQGQALAPQEIQAQSQNMRLSPAFGVVPQQRSSQVLAQRQEVKAIPFTTPRFGIKEETRNDQKRESSIINIQTPITRNILGVSAAQITTSITGQRQRQIQTPQSVFTQVPVADTRRTPTTRPDRVTTRTPFIDTTYTPEPPKVPGKLWLPEAGGSSGNRQFSPMGSYGWSNLNPVGADILSEGGGGGGFGDPFSSGGGRDNAKCRHKTMKAKMNCSRFWRNG